MFTIKVVDENNGKPVKDAVVGIAFDGFFGGCTKDIYTDSNGEAHFDYSNGNGKVYVKPPYSSNECYFEGSIQGRIIVYVK